MTKILVSSVGWVYLVVVLDWYTKKIVGWDLSLRSRSSEWKRALEMAIDREFPTSTSFINDMATLGIEDFYIL